MTWDQYLRITAIFLVAVMFSAGGASAMSVIAETQTTSNAEYPVCTAPCECISEHEAAMRWGVEGYEMCSKSICGQTADAMLQFYCIHQKGSIASPALVTTMAGTAATITTAPVTIFREPVKAPETSAAEVMTTPAFTMPAAIATKKAPSGPTGILAVIGVVLLGAARIRKK